MEPTLFSTHFANESLFLLGCPICSFSAPLPSCPFAWLYLPNSNIKSKVKFFFLLFSKIMWTFSAVNGISPLVILHLLLNMKSRSAKKEEIEQGGSRCRRKTVSYLGLCLVFCTNDLTSNIVKTWEKYIFFIFSYWTMFWLFSIIDFTFSSNASRSPLTWLGIAMTLEASYSS